MSIASHMSVIVTTMSDIVTAGIVVTGSIDSNGPWPWTTAHDVTMVVVRSATLAPVGPNRTAAQRSSGNWSASGVRSETAIKGESGPGPVLSAAKPVARKPRPSTATSTVFNTGGRQIQRGTAVTTQTKDGTTHRAERRLENRRWPQTSQ